MSLAREFLKNPPLLCSTGYHHSHPDYIPSHVAEMGSGQGGQGAQGQGQGGGSACLVSSGGAPFPPGTRAYFPQNGSHLPHFPNQGSSLSPLSASNNNNNVPVSSPNVPTYKWMHVKRNVPKPSVPPPAPGEFAIEFFVTHHFNFNFATGISRRD